MNFDKLASILGGTFEPIKPEFKYEGEQRGHITVDGVRFFINTGGYYLKGKVKVSTSYPYHRADITPNSRTYTQENYFNPEIEYPATCTLSSIKFSASKTEEQAAKDIQRRFLTEYKRLYAMAVKYCEEQEAYWNAMASTTDTIMDAVKGLDWAHVGYIRSNGAELKLDLSTDQVLKDLEFVKGLKQ